MKDTSPRMEQSDRVATRLQSRSMILTPGMSPRMEQSDRVATFLCRLDNEMTEVDSLHVWSNQIGLRRSSSSQAASSGVVSTYGAIR